MLDIRCRDDWDVMLIEDVIFFCYDLDYGWISLILISRIYITSWLVLDYFSYGDRVIMNDFIDIGDYITCSEFYDSYWSIWFIDDLEDGYIDDF